MISLKDENDAFGHLFYDYLHGRANAMAILERDDGHIDIGGDTAQYFNGIRKWPRRERDSIAHARGRVLDIGCGAGRCLLHLQKKGFEAIGIDNSPLAVKVCRERGVKKVRELSYTQISSAMGRFDTLIMYGNGLGMPGNPDRMRTFLMKMHMLTSDDARIIGGTSDPYKTKLKEHLEYHSRNHKAGRPGGQVRIRIRYKMYATPWLNFILMSKKELTGILSGTGWKITRTFESDMPLYTVILEKE